MQILNSPSQRAGGITPTILFFGNHSLVVIRVFACQDGAGGTSGVVPESGEPVVGALGFRNMFFMRLKVLRTIPSWRLARTFSQSTRIMTIAMAMTTPTEIAAA